MVILEIENWATFGSLLQTVLGYCNSWTELLLVCALQQNINCRQRHHKLFTLNFTALFARHIMHEILRAITSDVLHFSFSGGCRRLAVINTGWAYTATWRLMEEHYTTDSCLWISLVIALELLLILPLYIFTYMCPEHSFFPVWYVSAFVFVVVVSPRTMCHLETLVIWKWNT